MKAKLQFSQNDANYTDVAVSASTAQLNYQLRPITDTDRAGQKILLEYEVNLDYSAIELSAGFGAQEKYYFRLLFDDGKVIKLGNRQYAFDYDAALRRNQIKIYKIEINFPITTAQFTSFTTPAPDVPS
jgi:hypothetical protein